MKSTSCWLLSVVHKPLIRSNSASINLISVLDPIAIRAFKQSIPDNFIVMTAAVGDQTAKPLKKSKHRMFCYFLMKGMEGEAVANNDNEITAGELHSYVQTNVIQQSSGSQTPELQGDADRVLVRFQIERVLLDPFVRAILLRGLWRLIRLLLFRR